MSWLVQMEVDAQTAFRLKTVDNYQWHRRLWECFPGMPAGQREFLTRVDAKEGWFRLWVLSAREPIRPAWCGEPSYRVRQFVPVFQSGQLLRFDLKANPTKCVSSSDKAGNKPRHGKRVPLIAADDLANWLERKGSQGGFRLSSQYPLDIGPAIQEHFRRNQQAGYHSGVRFQGVLEITDPEKFLGTYQLGIGSAKGFGFGLLLIAPIGNQ